jgi:ribokinase
MAEAKRGVAVLGIFVADLAFRAGRMPGIGETIAGSGFKMGPGGKGSNQAVAAARVGADVTFISKIGKDEFGAIAFATWRHAGATARIIEAADQPTGAAFIYVNDRTGENAIIVVSGAAATMTPEDVEAAADAIRASVVFVTQLEQPAAAAHRGLEIAKEAGVVTIFNPAPAGHFDESLYLRPLRLRDAERKRGGSPDRRCGGQCRGCAQGGGRVPRQRGRRGVDHAR